MNAAEWVGKLPQIRKHIVNSGNLGQGQGGKGIHKETEPICLLLESQAWGRVSGGPGATRVPLLLVVCDLLDMLLVFPEPQSSQLYNGRVRENQRDMRTETGRRGRGGLRISEKQRQRPTDGG